MAAAIPERSRLRRPAPRPAPGDGRGGYGYWRHPRHRFIFGTGSRLGEHAGLLVTAGLVLVVSNLVDLSAIASVGSAVALMVFLLVATSGWRRRRDTGSRPAVIIAAFAVTAVVLGFFSVDTLQNEPATFAAIIALGGLSVVLDAIVRHRHDAKPSPRPPASQPVAPSSA